MFRNYQFQISHINLRGFGILEKLMVGKADLGEWGADGVQ